MDDKYFDQKSADEWTALIEGESAGIRDQDIYPHLSKWIWDNDITNVLDIGCGQGVCSAKIPPTTLYTGIEPSPYLLDRARNLYSAATFLEGSAYDIPFADSTFDGAFSIAVWHLLSDINKATAEMARVLRSGGYYLIITADPNAEGWKKSPDHLHLRSENEIGDALIKFKLKPTRIGAIRSFWFFEGIKA